MVRENIYDNKMRFELIFLESLGKNENKRVVLFLFYFLSIHTNSAEWVKCGRFKFCMKFKDKAEQVHKFHLPLKQNTKRVGVVGDGAHSQSVPSQMRNE